MKRFDINKTKSTGRVFHIPGDGRRESGLDGSQQPGDYLITPDFKAVFMIMRDGDKRKLEGMEFEKVIKRAKELHAQMVLDAALRDRAKGKRVPINIESVEDNIRRLQAERVSGKNKVNVNPERNISDLDESIH